MQQLTISQRAVSEGDRQNGKITGLFFISATVSAIIGLKLYDPILQTPDYLTSGAANSSGIILGAVFELILIGAAVGTGIMLFPYLQKYNSRLALGYLVFRFTEAILILVGVVSVLSLLSLSQSYTATVAQELSPFTAAGTILLAIHDWTFLLGPCLFLGVNTFIYSYVFLRTKLVPRALAILGICSAGLIFISGLLAMFNLVPLFSTIAILLALPIASYEMILAGWIIVNGFHVNK